MPIIKIELDGEELEFKIKPINRKVYINIVERYISKNNVYSIIDRAGIFSHIIKEPKMNRADWNEVPSSLLTRIQRSIEFYIESVEKKHKELRQLNLSKLVLQEELNDLYSFVKADEKEDWVCNAIIYKKDRIKEIDKMENEIKDSLNHLKQDDVIFDEKGIISYDIQT